MQRMIAKASNSLAFQQTRDIYKELITIVITEFKKETHLWYLLKAIRT